MKKIKIVKNIGLILCVIGCIFMLYLTWFTYLPINIYFWKNPDISMNTKLYFTIIFIIGLIESILLLILINTIFGVD